MAPVETWLRGGLIQEHLSAPATCKGLPASLSLASPWCSGHHSSFLGALLERSGNQVKFVQVPGGTRHTGHSGFTCASVHWGTCVATLALGLPASEEGRMVLPWCFLRA